MKLPAFLVSIRARLLLVSLVLLLIPIAGFQFITQMESYLREGQQRVLLNGARLLSATLSDRPQLLGAAATLDTSDVEERRRTLALFGSSDPGTAAGIGANYVPSEDIERILGVVAQSASRIWVVDSQSRVRGLVGSLNGTDPRGASLATPWYQSLPHLFLGWFIRYPASTVLEDTDTATRAVMQQVDRALIGQPTAYWRIAKDGRTIILSAAQPIWQRDNIVGAVVVEESNRDSQSVTYAALEALLAISLVVFFAGFVALAVFAWRLAYRVGRLQRETDTAIDAQGRIRGKLSASEQRDELGSLAHTLEAMLERLARYNEYLEKMAARLSHELRTPVAVVRSSLDNLRQARLESDQQIYVERADEGVQRLTSLISRMSEATQLEQMLQGAEREQFDLGKVVVGCVEGYRLVYPGQSFELLVTSSSPVLIDGMPDAIAQLLDKLVQNSVDFATPGTDIKIGLSISVKTAVLFVENFGSIIPEEAQQHLFASMVSARPDTDSRDGHLGLGLYIVRLIADFHHAHVQATNLQKDDGVRFEVRFARA